MVSSMMKNSDTVAGGRIVPTTMIVTGSQPKAKKRAGASWPSSLCIDISHPAKI
jgi:hypothetical protein